jgi:GNAT superfamily N-acetyltransferase
MLAHLDRAVVAAPACRIVEAVPAQLDAVRALFRDYAGWVPAQICFQGFERELAELPGDYARPRGRLLLAVAEDGCAVACITLRPVDDETCEIRRLYVQPAQRSRGLGRRLVGAALHHAQEAGYRRATLQTLPSMAEARQLYDSLGFREHGQGSGPADVIQYALMLHKAVSAS